MIPLKKWIIALLISVLAFGFLSLQGQSETTINFSQEELDYIANNPVLRMGVDPEFIPFEFLEDGSYKGIASDYVKIIENKTGLVFQLVPNLSWSQAYVEALNGNIDVLPAILKTPAREEDFLFSKMYYQVRRVIVSLSSNNEYRTINDLFGRTVAVQVGSSHYSYLLGFPQINISVYNTVQEALTAVSDGREVAFVGNLATSDYFIKSSGLTNLRFTALPWDQATGLHFAVQKDSPELISIINKVLDSVTAEERFAINARWVTVESFDSFDYQTLIRIIVGIILVIVLIGGISLFWIMRLSKEVQQRKKTQIELEMAKKIAEEANQVKSSFMARMSHEIRTPLNAITGMAYLLKKTDVSMTQRMYLERISQASTNMLSLINDILDYSKIEASKITLESISFSLDQVIHTLLSIMAVKFEDKGLNFRFTKDPAVPTYFFWRSQAD